MQRLNKQILLHNISPFLEIYDVCMLNYVIREAKDMYKYVIHANILKTTDIRNLITKCPSITSLFIDTYLSGQDSDDESVTSDNESKDNDNDEDDLNLLQQLHITKIVISPNTLFDFPLTDFEHLLYIEADHIHMIDIHPTLEEIKARRKFTYDEKIIDGNLKRVHAPCSFMVDSYIPRLLPYKSIDLKFINLTYLTGPGNSVWSSKMHRNIINHLSEEKYVPKTSRQCIDNANRFLHELSTLQITSLSLNDQDIDTKNMDLHILRTLPLTELHLTQMDIPDALHCMNITTLTMDRCNSVRIIPFKNLKHLLMDETDFDITMLYRKPLISLYMKHCTVKNIYEIVRLRIQELSIEDMNITVLHTELHKLPLTKLILSDISISDDNNLLLPSTLTYFQIADSYININYNVLPPNLTHFHAECCNFTINNIKKICTLPLVSLELRACKITDEMMYHISKLDLQCINISSNRVTCKGIKLLKHMKLRKLKCDEMSVCQLLK